MERRLAAILAADVVGYTALMGADEDGTLRRLTELRQEILEPLISEHHGRIFKLMGDGLLVEFASVVNSVACALAWQKVVTKYKADDEDTRLRFRIGINLGDVIVEGDDIHGDGVNIAARLEGLAEPGGIYLSDDAFRQAKGKIEAEFEDMGKRNLKNVAEPIRIYRVVTTVSDAISAKPSGEPLPIPDMPSIAVLPFANMSADPEQEFFSDGITEDIITALSKISSILVIARNSTFTYKGKSVDVKQVGREQGVRYVLEGSVRKAGGRVRVTAQLIDATTGGHLWAERYDRDLKDIFAVQDGITREVVIALDVRLNAGEKARFWSNGTKNLEAWECVRLGVELNNRGTSEGHREARRLCKRALDLDADYAMAWVTLGWTHHLEVDVGYGNVSKENREVAVGTAMDCAKKALELDPLSSDAYSLLGMCHLSKNEYDQAIAMSEQSVAVAPNHAESLALSAVIQNKSGRPERSLELIKKAMRLCPICPSWYPWVLGMAYRLTGQVDAAIGAFEASIERSADFLAVHVSLAASLGELGRGEEAQKAVSEISRLAPDFSIEMYLEGLSYKDPVELARFENGLLNAGLPA
jgi:adenylate cyclase